LALDPFDFERLVGSLFEKLGFNVEVTKPTGDGGIDVQAEKIATGTHELPYRGKYFIQCKRFKPGNKISNGDILKFVGAIATMGGKGIFVTTSTFTTPAQEVAETAGINLIDGKELERLLKRFGLV
jgi:restriction system protein